MDRVRPATSFVNDQERFPGWGNGDTVSRSAWNSPDTAEVAQCHPSRARNSTVRPHSRTRRRSCAFTATMTVLSDISTAPTAGWSTMPYGASTPAASGMATML